MPTEVSIYNIVVRGADGIESTVNMTCNPIDNSKKLASLRKAEVRVREKHNVWTYLITGQ